MNELQQQMNAAYAAMSGQAQPQTAAQPPMQQAQQTPAQYIQPQQYAQPAQYPMPPAQYAMPQAAPAWGQPQALPMPQAWSVPVTLTIDGEEVTIYIHFDPSTLGNADAVIRALLAQGYAVKHYPKKQSTLWNRGTGSAWRK